MLLNLKCLSFSLLRIPVTASGNKFQHVKLNLTAYINIINNSTCNILASDKEENNAQDDSETNQSATDAFFRRDTGSTKNFDKIIEELIKACQETKKNECRQDVPSTNSTQHQPDVNTKQAFSAGLKDGRIELGFHVKDSERLFRLSGGNLLPKKNRNNQSLHDIGKCKGPR